MSIQTHYVFSIKTSVIKKNIHSLSVTRRQIKPRFIKTASFSYDNLFSDFKLKSSATKQLAAFKVKLLKKTRKSANFQENKDLVLGFYHKSGLILKKQQRA